MRHRLCCNYKPSKALSLSKKYELWHDDAKKIDSWRIGDKKRTDFYKCSRCGWAFTINVTEP